MGGVEGDVLAAAWPAAVDEILARVATIEDAVAALLGGALDDDERDGARRAAHRLAGTLGTFGIATGSVIARELETALETAPAAAEAPQLAERALALRRSVESAPPPAAEAAGLRVVLAGLPGVRSGALMRAAADRGWRIATVAGAPETDDADVVVLDGGLPHLDALVARLADDGIAVAVLVDHEVDRVALVRAGARRLIPTAARPEAVVREVAELDGGRRAGAQTILAVDDDPVGLTVLRAALDGAGYDVETLDDPLGFWDALERARPDLVVLDVQMPGADGLDLCRGLRADPRWRDLPVLFLTATTSAPVVAELFAVGGDDYIPKPVQPLELVARVAGRLERMSQVRAAGELDDLTGLQRRGAAEPLLERLIALSARLGEPFAIVALSVDGAPTLAADDRDTALAVAGQAGRDVLRAGDVGGVWGGGELILGLAGRDGHDARSAAADVLAALRGADPALTASAGVAEHPRDGADPATLIAAASNARRDAEANGGDRVEVAGEPSGGRERADVVLVEDDAILARLILDALELRGYTTRWIDDGEDAAALLGGERPALQGDLVLLDWDLPAQDGLTVLRGLAADGVLAATKVVMLTARASQREVLTALELGATDHVAKPFSVAVLMRRVERVLER
jgi:DNA-binding response OmpR family regulator/HPt (histidine-containing phosphotransfer) domain-containing protein